MICYRSRLAVAVELRVRNAENTTKVAEAVTISFLKKKHWRSPKFASVAMIDDFAGEAAAVINSFIPPVQ